MLTRLCKATMSEKNANVSGFFLLLSPLLSFRCARWAFMSFPLIKSYLNSDFVSLSSQEGIVSCALTCEIDFNFTRSPLLFNCVQGGEAREAGGEAEMVTRTIKSINHSIEHFAAPWRTMYNMCGRRVKWCVVRRHDAHNSNE